MNGVDGARHHLRIRAYREDDRHAVETILRDTWPDDPLMRELQDLHRPAQDEPWRRTLVVEADGLVIAVATVRLGRRHPLRYWFSLNVAPSFRREGIGSQLLSDLRSFTAHDPRPFRLQARPSDRATMSFLRHHAFRCLVRTWDGLIDPRDEVVLRRLAGLAAGAERFRFTRPRGEALGDELPRIATFYEDWYHAIHRWEPPARWPIVQSLDHFCGADLIKDSVTCVWRDTELIGVGSLIVPPFDAKPDELYLVQLGVLRTEPANSQRLTAMLVSDMLAFAAEEKKMVRFEVDDAHADLWSVLEAIPLVSSSRDFAIFADDVERQQ